MLKNNPKIAILFLGYNDKKNLFEAISSVKSQNYSNFDIFYLDNDSNDGSVEYVRDFFPFVRIFKEKNLGYAGTYAKYLPLIFSQNYEGAVLINTDIIVDQDWLKNLVIPAFKNEKIASAQPKIYLWQNKKTKKINTLGNPVHFLGIGYCGHYEEEDKGQFNKKTDLFYSSGCCLLIKKSAFEQIGNLDQDFFMYLEDQDWGSRAKLLNKKNILCVNSKMWHKYQFQKNPKNKQKFFYLERNRFFFLLKNYPKKILILIFPAFLVLELGILFHSIKNHYFKEKILAYVDFFKFLPSIVKKRQETQAKKVISDKEFLSMLSPTLEIKNMQEKTLKLANLFFQWYYELIKKFI